MVGMINERMEEERDEEVYQRLGSIIARWC